MASKRTRTAWFLGLSIALTVLLYVVPFGHVLAWPLLLLSTLAHEAGHGVTAWLVGGHFDRFVMYADASGMATTRVPASALAQAAVSAGGLVGPAVVAAVLFAFAGSPRAARVALWALALTCVVGCVLVVRNVFGLLFVGGVGVALGALARFLPRDGTPLATMFLAVQLALAVFSRADYLFVNVAHTAAGDAPSDVAQIASALGGPYWLWGGLVGLLSVAILAIGLLSALRRR